MSHTVYTEPYLPGLTTAELVAYCEKIYRQINWQIITLRDYLLSEEKYGNSSDRKLMLNELFNLRGRYLEVFSELLERTAAFRGDNNV